MAKAQPNAPKKQLSLDQYMKVKEKRAKDKLKLHLPLPIKLIFCIPVVYFIFTIVYFLMSIRHLPEH